MESPSKKYKTGKDVSKVKGISANKQKENLLNNLIFNIEIFNKFHSDLKNIHISKREKIELDYFTQFLKMINSNVDEIKKTELRRKKGGRHIDESAKLALEIIFDYFYSENKKPPRAKWLAIEVNDLFTPMNNKIEEINIEKLKNNEKLNSLLRKTNVDEKTARKFIKERCEKFNI
jgi:hypothetical protein